MNDRIQALWEQAVHGDGPHASVIADFAELIVQDACTVLQNWKEEPFPFDEDLAVSLLKEHFGVKE